MFVKSADLEKALAKICNLLKSSDIRFTQDLKLVFICGGPLETNETEKISVRKQILTYSAKNVSKSEKLLFIISEKVFECYQDVEFLLTNHTNSKINLNLFESILASIADCIFIVVESAGSIAELGYFSAIEKHRKKTLLALKVEHYNQRSFIKNGPVDLIYADSTLSVQTFDTDLEKPIQSMIEEISKSKCRVRKTMKINLQDIFKSKDRVDNVELQEFSIILTIFSLVRKIYPSQLQYIIKHSQPARLNLFEGASKKKLSRIGEKITAMIAIMIAADYLKIETDEAGQKYFLFLKESSEKTLLKKDTVLLVNSHEATQILTAITNIYDRQQKKA